MELNSDLVSPFNDVRVVIPSGISGTHNIIKLSTGLCHSDNLFVKVNGDKLDESKFARLLPSSEFRIRYNMDSVSAIMLLDNTITGSVTIECRPIGGIFQNVELSSVPTVGKLMDFTGRWLEEFGEITGLENFYRSFDDIPSRATDIDGILYGRTSYPGSGDVGASGDVLDRVLLLEQKAFHSDVSIPTINVQEGAYTIHDRAAPRVQFTSDAPDVTWHFHPERSDIFINLNPVTGEIMWVDGIADADIYAVTIYIMSNGIRSENTIVHLNVL